MINSSGSWVLLGTGEGTDYSDGRLEGLSVRNGEEVCLFRAVSEAEYSSIVNNSNSFVFYEWAIEKKWFATNLDHAKKWAKWLYVDGIYRIVEVVVLNESLKYMFYVKMLDNIGPAYAADIKLLNKIVRRIKLYEKDRASSD